MTGRVGGGAVASRGSASIVGGVRTSPLEPQEEANRNSDAHSVRTVQRRPDINRIIKIASQECVVGRALHHEIAAIRAPSMLFRWTDQTGEDVEWSRRRRAALDFLELAAEGQCDEPDDAQPGHDVPVDRAPDDDVDHHCEGE